MEAVIFICSVIYLIISVIVLVKFFGLCNDVKRIADNISPKDKHSRIDPEEMSEEEAEDQFKRDIQNMGEY